VLHGKSGCLRLRAMQCGAEFRPLDRFLRQRIGRNQCTERVQSFAYCRSTRDMRAITRLLRRSELSIVLQRDKVNPERALETDGRTINSPRVLA
jgi:hypothetical protein